MVTVGVLVSTAATAQLKTQTPSGAGSFTTWVIGLLMLTYGLFGSATTGVFQEKLFARSVKGLVSVMEGVSQPVQSVLLS